MGTSLSDVCDYLYHVSERLPSCVSPVGAPDESQKWAIVALRFDPSLRRRLRRFAGARCNAPIYVQRRDILPSCTGGGVDTGAPWVLELAAFTLPLKQPIPVPVQ